MMDLRSRLADTRLPDAGHGFDEYGLSRAGVERAARLLSFLYERYFRVCSVGGENLPPGAGIIAANHGGGLPFDAAMLWLDIMTVTQPPRVARPVADHFTRRLPFVGTWMARGGVVDGTPETCAHLLSRGELLMIYPEGTAGIGKPASQKNRTVPFRVGHVELAIRHRVPVIPVGVVGPDEQWPVWTNLALHPFGAPHVPLPMTPVPLPVRTHIHYGAPLSFTHLPPESADDPRVLVESADRVRAAVDALIAEGLSGRKGLFA